MPTNKSIKDLLADKMKPSKAFRFRKKLSEIEEAITAGASHQEIVDELKKQGLDLSIPIFNKYLHFERKKLGRSPNPKKTIETSMKKETTQSEKQEVSETSEPPIEKNLSHRRFINGRPDVEWMAREYKKMQEEDERKEKAKSVFSKVPKLPNGQPDIDWAAREYLKSKGKL